MSAGSAVWRPRSARARGGWRRLAGVTLLASQGSLAVAGTADSPVPDWKELKGQHFIVQHQADAAYAGEVARRAEQDYDRIARALGITRHGGFWLWDNRARISVYATREAYLAAARAPDWSGGVAQYTTRTILTFQGSDAFLNSILPHEITHLVFREFIGFRQDIPLWLDEGVAQWMDASNRGRVVAIAKQRKVEGQLAPVSALTAAAMGRGVDARDAVAFYAQSASLVGFMLAAHGVAKFREFCGHLRDQHTLEDALRFTYPNTLRSVEALDRAWNAYLEAKPHEQQAGRIYTH